MIKEVKPFGEGDNSYQSAGEKEGLMKLSKRFYQVMEETSQGQLIFVLHKGKIGVSVDKLALFLCGWLGGPRYFQEKYGPIHIPRFHSSISIGEPEKESWLFCMKEALKEQDYSEDFKAYIYEQLKVPANRIVEVQKK